MYKVVTKSGYVMSTHATRMAALNSVLLLETQDWEHGVYSEYDIVEA